MGRHTGFALGLPLLCGLVVATLTPIPVAAQTAVIVNPDSELRELSLPELRDLFLGRADAVGNDLRPVLLENRELRDDFYDLAFDMSVREVKRRWIAVVLSGGNARPPEDLPDDEILARVADTDNALSFVDLSAVDASVRVVLIDGSLPDDAAYPVR